MSIILHVRRLRENFDYNRNYPPKERFTVIGAPGPEPVKFSLEDFEDIEHDIYAVKYLKKETSGHKINNPIMLQTKHGAFALTNQSFRARHDGVEFTARNIVDMIKGDFSPVKDNSFNRASTSGTSNHMSPMAAANRERLLRDGPKPNRPIRSL